MADCIKEVALLSGKPSSKNHNQCFGDIVWGENPLLRHFSKYMLCSMDEIIVFMTEFLGELVFLWLNTIQERHEEIAKIQENI